MSKLVVLSAPSGAGNSTICGKLLERNPSFQLSVSATTRSPRPYERDGEHYFFLSMETFMEKVRKGDFLEYEEIHGKNLYYGTLRSVIEKALTDGTTILLDIDVNGALKIKENFNAAILIFIKPPSEAALRERLIGRKSDTQESIERRLKRLPMEYEKGKLFDYAVVNDDLETAVQEVETIIRNHK